MENEEIDVQNTIYFKLITGREIALQKRIQVLKAKYAELNENKPFSLTFKEGEKLFRLKMDMLIATSEEQSYANINKLYLRHLGGEDINKGIDHLDEDGKSNDHEETQKENNYK